ncbi:hypothetical protein B0H14DRAFT_3484075 [Mycena olivaceomarginata]|nr:hypothetical protein B0H14DRAFT_3484075 [Mycena olivaceomarginata]
MPFQQPGRPTSATWADPRRPASADRLHQGSVIQDKAICFVATVKKMKCTGKDAAGAACDGYRVLKTATKVSVTF